MKVWIVSEVTFEWETIKHICLSKETALIHFEELRQEMIRDDQDMVDHSLECGTSPVNYKRHIEMLQNYDSSSKWECDSCSDVDHPQLTEWDVEP